MNEFSHMYDFMRKFWKREDGNPTVEFVILFPLFIFLFLTGFETGYFMVRGVMLERGVDMAVREVRLSNGQVPDYAVMKRYICSQAAILPDCENNIQIQMEQVPITPGGIASVQGPARCVDKLSTADALTGTNYETGVQNQLMIVRVCSLAQPLFPTTSIGARMAVDSEGNYALVRTAAFVTEPGNRQTITLPGSGSGGTGGGGVGSGGTGGGT